MRAFTNLNDILTAKGELLGTSDWFAVTQSRIQMFADATEDQQWIHVDETRAAAGPHGTAIAHGFLTLALIPAMTSGVIQYSFEPVRLNYGLDRVRFIAPVPVGSRVRDNITVRDAELVSGGVRLSLRHSVEIEEEDKPACIAETITMIMTPD